MNNCAGLETGDMSSSGAIAPQFTEVVPDPATPSHSSGHDGINASHIFKYVFPHPTRQRMQTFRYIYNFRFSND